MAFFSQITPLQKLPLLMWILKASSYLDDLSVKPAAGGDACSKLCSQPLEGLPMDATTTAPALRPDALKALRQLANGTPAELVNLSSLRALERAGYVEWATEGHYGRVITQAGRDRAALEAMS